MPIGIEYFTAAAANDVIVVVSNASPNLSVSSLTASVTSSYTSPTPPTNPSAIVVNAVYTPAPVPIVPAFFPAISAPCLTTLPTTGADCLAALPITVGACFTRFPIFGINCKTLGTMNLAAAAIRGATSCRLSSATPRAFCMALTSLSIFLPDAFIIPLARLNDFL